MSISDEDLIDQAQAAYRRQTSRAHTARGEHWPIIPAGCWSYEVDEAGRDFVVAYHGSDEVRMHWNGHRFAQARFTAQ